MDLPADRVPEAASSTRDLDDFDIPPAAILALDEQAAFDLHREINARRAQVENPELLRRIRSL